MSRTEDQMNHAWRYFELHANQRMTVFNFFLVTAGLIAAGIAASMQASAKLGLMGALLGLLLVLTSFVFWKLDQRVSMLIKHAEQALAQSECGFEIKAAHLFELEPELTSRHANEGNSWTKVWTYGRSFRLTFWAFGTTGLIALAIALLRYFTLITW